MSLLLKPVGDACDLACTYCFYRGVGPSAAQTPVHMPEEVLAALLFQILRPGGAETVELAWQGGEPLLAGVDFYRRAFELERRFRPRGVTVLHTFQTNGRCLDEQLAQLLAERACLVGISIDGPARLHDAARASGGGEGSHAEAVRAVALLQRLRVEVNALVAVHAANQGYGREVYRYLVDELGIRHLQILPVAGRSDGQPYPMAADVDRYGDFLLALLDEWRSRDVGRVFVQPIEAVRARLAGAGGTLCVWEPTCGLNPVVERNGDVFACDHFVAAPYRLGNLLETPLLELLLGARQLDFGRAKRARRAAACDLCPERDLCGGGCPKDRAGWGEEVTAVAPSSLCRGYRAFFAAAREALRDLSCDPGGQPAADRSPSFDLPRAS